MTTVTHKHPPATGRRLRLVTDRDLWRAGPEATQQWMYLTELDPAAFTDDGYQAASHLAARGLPVQRRQNPYAMHLRILFAIVVGLTLVALILALGAYVLSAPPPAGFWLVLVGVAAAGGVLLGILAASIRLSNRWHATTAPLRLRTNLNTWRSTTTAGPIENDTCWLHVEVLTSLLDRVDVAGFLGRIGTGTVDVAYTIGYEFMSVSARAVALERAGNTTDAAQVASDALSRLRELTALVGGFRG